MSCSLLLGESFGMSITLLFQYWLLLIAISCFLELTLGLAEWYTHCHCSLGAETGPNTPSWQGTQLIPLWPWTGPFSLTLCRKAHATLFVPRGQARAAWGKDSCPLSVKTALVIQLENLSFNAFTLSLPKNKNHLFCSLIPLEWCVIVP